MYVQPLMLIDVDYDSIILYTQLCIVRLALYWKANEESIAGVLNTDLEG